MQAGYEVIFTSDKNLNALRGRAPSHMLGRVSMDSREITDGSGHLKPEMLA
jgi:hypothetical protein